MKSLTTIAGGFAMKIPTLTAPRGFQFRLGTLLLAIVWVAIVCMGLRSASEPWSGILSILSMGSLLVAALMSIYRTGRTRAFALGFLIVGGYYEMMSENEHNYDDPSTALPSLITTNWSIALYSRIHGDGAQMTVQTVSSPVPAPYPNWPVAPAASYQVVSETATIVPATPPSAGAVAPPPPTETPIPIPSTSPPTVVALPQLGITPVPMIGYTRTIRTQTVSLSAFLSVAHNSLLMLVGLIGGITAQYLHATRRDDSTLSS
jgi:hypothetical protein